MKARIWPRRPRQLTARGLRCLPLLLFIGIAGLRSYAATDYTISLANPAQHLAEVQIVLGEGSAERDLQLPVWNALYQVRDFAQYLNWVRAKDRAGRPLSVHTINPSLLQISGAEGGAVVQYQIFVNSPGPFGAELNSSHAFFNLAQLLMYPVDARSGPMRVRFSQIPQGWRIATPLTALPDGLFSAGSYDKLVDSPVEIGTFQEADFAEGGAQYRVVVDADTADYRMENITAMLQKIVASATSWMDDRPFQTYMFLYHFPHGPGGGGMEHSYSTAIAMNADALAGFPDLLASVSAHEFFHLWNVKRIRPQTLEPVDYTKPNYTRALWFSEGCTSAAADIIQLRAGLLDERSFERQLSSAIAELEQRPAHLMQSAEESSVDAWLEGYPYYRNPERSISYYNKGELLGIALDLAVRNASHGQASLREVFQWMNQNYAKKEKYFDDSQGVRRAAEAVSHADLGWFFEKYVAGTEEIPWNDLLNAAGLRVEEGRSSLADAGFVASRNFDGRMNVTAVAVGSDAEKAGLQVGDTIAEINGRVPGQDSSQGMAGLRAGDTVAVKIQSRRGGDRELKWKVGKREEISFEVKDLDTITPEQRARRAAWLKGEAEATSTRQEAPR
jgi:predicted metalloprotease with PDZ domain